MANVNSDVKLFPGQVKIEAWDVCLDSPDRRKSTTEFRRALVHDFNDGLTVNWGEDYPGGVTLNGVTRITGKKGTVGAGQAFSVVTIDATNVAIGSGLSALTFTGVAIHLKREPAAAEGVKITGDAQFEDNVVFTGTVKLKKPASAGTVGGPGTGPGTPYYDLNEEIQQLRARLAALEKKIP